MTKKRASFKTSLPAMPVQSFVLANGLRVVVVEDHFAPTVSVAVVYDVGARCEKKGRSGFAHLFEHMMFQGSANVGKMQHIQLIEAQGGILNGFTMKDFTAYYETLPSSQLELGLWLEADRMCSLAITRKNFDNQKDVVQNEKRWRYDNNPYMTAMGEVFPAMTFEKWENQHSVIGSMQDLDLATIEDIREFFNSYYAPNNAVLVVVGDARFGEARGLIEKCFGPMPKRSLPARPDLIEVAHAAFKRETYGDRFAKLPALMMGWKAPLRDDPCYPALMHLSEILAGGEDSRLYQLLVKNKKWALSVSGGLGWPIGSFQTLKDPSPFGLFIHAKPGVDLGEIARVVCNEIKRMGREGVKRDELTRASRKMRASLLDEYQSSENKSYWLGIFTLLNGGNPKGFDREINRFLSSPSQKALRQAALTWLSKDTCSILEVLPDPSAPAPAAGASRPQDESREEAPPGAQAPPINTETKPFPRRKIEDFVLANGLRVLFSRDERIPFVKWSLGFPVTAALHDSRRAQAEALAELLKSGTRGRTSRQIEQELALLGADFSASCDADYLTVHGSVLKETAGKYFGLARDFLMEPSFPKNELDLWRENSLQALEDQRSRPGFLASERFLKELFGDHPYGIAVPTKEAITAVERRHAQELRDVLIDPSKAVLCVVGDISLKNFESVLERSLGKLSHTLKFRSQAPISEPLPPT
ncbi:MAG: insulinase family protein, partial [Elusimicrobia bacterium]|nr:insulinase family protein [Elusimicrobiota bacterium]